ncbi:hypothetical protein [Mucilaginibacter sp.]|uniref:hypothetical protein n=1 Tax=Mucilaginibacter sp. TaxID=1882438 RepID=UPI0025F57567|nr:hypothetical protein [Mucilaginibacter sp.]
MAAKSNKHRVILIDADVVSHFIYAGEILSLGGIFTNPIHILDKVYAELARFPQRKQYVENLLNMKIITVIDFPEDHTEIKKEYAHIKKLMLKGDGESACMAVARHSENILASSNLKDIASYCKMHRIDYLTTMDFLCRALQTGVFDLARCNAFIQAVLSNKNKLPVTKMQDYICRDIGFCDQ